VSETFLQISQNPISLNPISFQWFSGIQPVQDHMRPLMNERNWTRDDNNDDDDDDDRNVLTANAPLCSNRTLLSRCRRDLLAVRETDNLWRSGNKTARQMSVVQLQRYQVSRDTHAFRSSSRSHTGGWKSQSFGSIHISSNCY